MTASGEKATAAAITGRELSVLAAVLWPSRRTFRASAGRFFREQRRNWIPVAVINTLFALPIVVNLVLHWPGDFGKYISYGGSGRAGGHSPRQVMEYVLWFWWPHRYAWLAPLLSYPAALAAVRWLSPARLRGYYIGYCCWPAPLIAVLVVVLAATAGVAVLAVIPVQAERAGVRACLEDPWYTFLMTRQLICTSAQAASGQAYWFYTPRGLPPHAPVLLRFSGITVVAAAP